MLKKYIYILVTLLFFLFVTVTHYVSTKTTVVEVREVYNTEDLISNCEIKQLTEKNEKYEIDVYYPETEYLVLNEKINNKITEFIEEFKNEIAEISPVEGEKFKLEINFTSYEYEKYFSYAFSIYTDFGGAHPNTIIWTISYNIEENKEIDIDFLIEKNESILNILSTYSFEELKENEKIKENYLEETLKNGTAPLKENFKNFIFTKDGLRILFQKYSVAPYSSGEFSVTIPYSRLNIF